MSLAAQLKQITAITDHENQRKEDARLYSNYVTLKSENNRLQGDISGLKVDIERLKIENQQLKVKYIYGQHVIYYPLCKYEGGIFFFY